jgi:hypothetical protein
MSSGHVIVAPLTGLSSVGDPAPVLRDARPIASIVEHFQYYKNRIKEGGGSGNLHANSTLKQAAESPFCYNKFYLSADERIFNLNGRITSLVRSLRNQPGPTIDTIIKSLIPPVDLSATFRNARRCQKAPLLPPTLHDGPERADCKSYSWFPCRAKP